ncbi:MAG TPA: helix-turn-helix domain-containing protein [Dehalococcoidia bacterium]|nr:helix-turn-helix domain-containing protein [Dehalococcoidia bacterium]
MSLKVMTLVWQSSPLTGAGLLVELALADFSDDSGTCWPSVHTLARKARCSDRQVQRTLDQLVRLGRLRRQERPRARGDNLTSLYQFLLTPEQLELGV